MKKISVAVAIICVLVSSVTLNAQGLVSWWQGNGNLIDSVGSNNGLLDLTNISFSYGAGEINQAFNLNGAFITVPDSVSLQPATITVQAWLKSSSSQPYAYIVTKVNNAGGAYGVNMSYALYTGSGGLNFFVSTGSGTGAYSYGAAATNVWDGNWHQVTGTFDGTLARLYVDGIEQTNNNGLYETSSGNLYYSNPDSLMLGAATTNGSSPWKGGMDEVRILDHALTASEVMDSFSNPASTALTTGLISYYNADNNTQDSAGTNNGTTNNVITHIPAPFTFGAGHNGKGFLPLGGYAYVPNSPSLQPANVTVQAWMKSAGRGVFQYILSKDGYHIYTGGSAGVAFWNSDPNHVSPAVNPGGIWDGAWHLVTGVYDGTNHIYVDGSEVGTGGGNANVTVYGGGAFTFGAYDTSDSASWAGGLDEVKFFGAALSSQQVLSNYLGELNGSLVGWWRAETNANDVTTKNNGTVSGAASYSNSKFVGKAFNTSGGVVVIPDSPSLRPTNSVTVEAFVQATPPGPNKYIVSKSASSANGSYALYTGPSGGLIFYVQTPSGRVESPTVSPTDIWDGAYHEVAGKYDGRNVRIYLDGFEVGNGTPASGQIQYSATQNTGELLFGDFSDTASSANFAGNIDDVRIYAAARSLHEIRADYASGIAILVPPQGQSVQLGSNTTLSVTAYGPPPLSYQWRHDGTNLLTATNSTLVLSNLQAADLGAYDVKISGSSVHFTSTVASNLSGQAFTFGNGVVDVPNAANLTPTNFTVQLWIRSSKLQPTYVYAFEKALSQSVPSIGLYTADTGGLKFIIGNDTNGSTFTASGVGIGTNVWDGNWHQVTGTWDGEFLNLYEDGALVESVDTFGLKSVAYNTTFQNGDIMIGGFRPTGPFINADIDEVKFFDHALSDADVLDTFNNPTTSPAGLTGLISWWKGDGNALDSIGSNSGLLAPPATMLLSDPATVAVGSFISLTNVNVSTGVVEASLKGSPGQTSIIQRSPSVLGPWAPIYTNIMPFTFTDSLAPGTNTFYRALLQ